MNSAGEDIPLLPSKEHYEWIEQLQTIWNLTVRPCQKDDAYALEAKENYLQLVCLSDPKILGFHVNFTDEGVTYRRKEGGGLQQVIAKAVGLKKGARPNVLDATAGFGRDAFVLASLGCRVHMIERETVVAALLDDGLRRAGADSEIGSWVKERLSMSCESILGARKTTTLSADVVYLDPMYPENKKTALVKKDMQILKDIVTANNDIEGLLSKALAIAKDRVVVKRPDYADWTADKRPDTSLKTKNHRFDIYLI